jgi:hypothetical protein
MAPPITNSAKRTPEPSLEGNVPAAPRRSGSPPPLPANVRTPPSGVRAAPPPAPSRASPSSPPTSPSPPTASIPPDMRPPLPSFRPRADSMDMTRVGAPNPILLAMARGAQPRQPRRITWFMLGTLVGGLVVWCATSDVRADVYGARVWTADVLRSLRGAPSSPAEDVTPLHVDAEIAPVPPPAPSSPPSGVAAPRAPAPVATEVAKDVPTVDVAALPRTPAPDVPVAAEPVTSDAPPSTAAPALPNAPGPR